jgi:hypothetical protein
MEGIHNFQKKISIYGILFANLSNGFIAESESDIKPGYYRYEQKIQMYQVSHFFIGSNHWFLF